MDVFEIKSCVLAIAKDEDKFLEEWINYHLALGFDHIFIIDNNPYRKRIRNEFENVTIIPFNDIVMTHGWLEQGYAYNYALQYIKKTHYTHLMVLDIDEFLTLHKHSSVKDFIIEEMVKKNRNIAEIVWETYDDNDIIWEKDTKTSVIETYTRKQTKMQPYCFNLNQSSWGKSLVKIFDELYYTFPHWPADELFDKGLYCTNHLSHDIAVVKHYRTKCLETYVKHKVFELNLKNGVGVYINNIIDFYFSFNKITNEKINAFKKIFHEYGIAEYDELLDGISNNLAENSM